MAYQPEPIFSHGTPPKTGILLVNLGTPDAPTPKAVRAYLKEFLGDPRVVEIPRAIWWLILNGIILNTRPKKSAAKYASIWLPQGSPLRVYTEQQAASLRAQLDLRGHPSLLVEHAMRYGKPSIVEVLRKMRAQNCQRILVVPLYPQYSASTTATVYDAVFGEMLKYRNTPALRTIKHFHDNAGYIKALANSINEYWAAHGKPEKLLMSFHGLPRYTLERGDPYHCECLKTGRLLAQELGLGEGQYLLTFQSRFGKEEWLQPYTATALQQLGAQKTARLDVVCPGFAADCLETLEEIAQEGKEIFQHAGGGDYRYLPCLNGRADWINTLADLVLDNLHGWLDEPDAAELEQSRLRALKSGAKK